MRTVIFLYFRYFDLIVLKCVLYLFYTESAVSE